MKPNTYKIIATAVDTGTLLGWHRAHKHTDTPTDEQVHDAIVDAVMLEICEWFDFEEIK
jgi:hypothetical protein